MLTNKINIKKTKKSGQTLIELMVAVGLIAMVVTALLVLVSAATKVGVSSLRRSQATKIATLALESVRFYRDKESYDNLPNPNNEICFIIDNEISPGSSPLTPTSCQISTADFQEVLLEGFSFYRQIKLLPEDSVLNSRDVIVEVRWFESGGTQEGAANYRQVILSTSISKW